MSAKKAVMWECLYKTKKLTWFQNVEMMWELAKVLFVGYYAVI